MSAVGERGAIVNLIFTGGAPKPSIFTIQNPARISMDLPGASLAAGVSRRSIDQGPIRTIRSASVSDGVRLVVTLRHDVPYHVRRSPGQISVYLNTSVADAGRAATTGQPNAAARASGARAPNTSTTTAANTDHSAKTRAAGRPERASSVSSRHSTPSGLRTVQHIDFRRAANGAGRVVVQLNRGNALVSVERDDGRVVAIIADTQLPARLSRRLDVRDFATPVDTIDATQTNGNTRLEITPADGVDFTELAYQTGNEVNIELRPVAATSNESGHSHKPEFTGKRISLSFQDIAVRKLLQILAGVGNVNMVISGQVGGNISLRLRDVPWDQALHIVLRSRGLGMRRNNNVISVAPLSQLAARDQAQRQVRQSNRSLAPVRTQLIKLNYAKASNIARLLKARSAGANALLSDRGTVNVDERTNSLIVSATRANIDAVKRLTNKLDRPQRQVLIRSRIVTATRDFTRKLGADFNIRGAKQKAGIGPGGNQLSGGDKRADQVNAGGFSVSLPAGNPAGQLATSIITGHINIGLVLNAAQIENRAKVISAPGVITANGQEAEISRGTQIPYLQAASSGAATVQFKEAVLSLKVTPRITPDNHVTMDLILKKDSVGKQIQTQGGGSEPAINTQRLQTRVLVDNGNTVVLGGIYTREDRNNSNRVPFFGGIPIVGRLFRNTNRERNRRELLLFITPRILDSDTQTTAQTTAGY